MSSKDRLITYAYKKTKNSSRNVDNVKKATDVKVQPSTSKSAFDKDMEVLRAFDLHLEYGPAVEESLNRLSCGISMFSMLQEGITRLERWRRADKHGLNPSEDVFDLITQHSDDERYTQSLWNDYKNVI